MNFHRYNVYLPVRCLHCDLRLVNTLIIIYHLWQYEQNKNCSNLLEECFLLQMNFQFMCPESKSQVCTKCFLQHTEYVIITGKLNNQIFVINQFFHFRYVGGCVLSCNDGDACNGSQKHIQFGLLDCILLFIFNVIVFFYK